MAKFFLAAAFGFTAVAQASLIQAVKFGTVEDVQKALRTEDINEQDHRYGGTPLMWAVVKNSTVKVQAILAKEPDMDLQNNDGWTALMAAAQYGTAEMVEEMLKHNPGVNLQSKDGWTALMDAARYGTPEMVEAVLAAGAAVDLQQNSGGTALFMAAESGHDDIVDALLHAGAAVDLADHAGRTPLFVAVKKLELTSVKVLLNNGARPELSAKNGQTALAVAVSMQQECQGQDNHSDLKKENDLENVCMVLIPRMIQLLEDRTPTGLELLKARMRDPGSRKIGWAIAAGIGSGILWHVWHWRTINESRPLGPRKLATKAVAPSPKCHLAFRGAEVVACALLPLGVGMLWLEVFVMLPVYLIFYTVPRCVELGRGALDSPALLLAGLPRQNGCSVAKTTRAMATAALLALTAWMPFHCEYEIGFAILGAAYLDDQLNGFLSKAMAKGTTISPPLLSTAASQFVCPRFNAMGFWPSRMFWIFLMVIWLVAFAWLIAVLLEMIGTLQAQRLTEADEDQIQQLEAMLSNTTTAEEVSTIQLGSATVEPEKGFVCNPFPGGVYFTVLMAALDGVVMDFVSILNLFRAGQFYFASCFTFITVTSTVAELLTALRMDSVLDQPRESVLRGIMTQPLATLLQMEQVFESPFSFCLSCYSWVFAVRGWFSFGSGVFGVLLGVYSLAESIYWLEDANLHRAEAETDLESDDDGESEREAEKVNYRMLLPVLEN